MLNNIKTIQKDRGFTIVELLIVIVVIGILAAITMVAYGGITTQANNNAAKANATNVAKVAEAYNADDSTPGGYPATVAALTGWTTGISRVPTGVSVSATNPASTDATTKARIGYAPVGTTGACISYWNYSTNALAWVFAGNGRTGGGAAGAAATCSAT